MFYIIYSGKFCIIFHKWALSIYLENIEIMSLLLIIISVIVWIDYFLL